MRTLVLVNSDKQRCENVQNLCTRWEEGKLVCKFHQKSDPVALGPKDRAEAGLQFQLQHIKLNHNYDHMCVFLNLHLTLRLMPTLILQQNITLIRPTTLLIFLAAIFITDVQQSEH